MGLPDGKLRLRSIDREGSIPVRPEKPHRPGIVFFVSDDIIMGVLVSGMNPDLVSGVAKQVVMDRVRLLIGQRASLYDPSLHSSLTHSNTSSHINRRVSHLATLARGILEDTGVISGNGSPVYKYFAPSLMSIALSKDTPIGIRSKGAYPEFIFATGTIQSR